MSEPSPFDHPAEPPSTTPPNMTPPPQKSGGLGVILLLALIGVVIYAVINSRGSSSTPTTPSTPARPAVVQPVVPATVKVLYEVYGTAKSADLTMQTPNGTSQQNGLAVPLTDKNGSVGLAYQMKTGEFVYVAAQNNGEYGEISCRITVEGKVIATNTSSGAYAIAQCDGTT